MKDQRHFMLDLETLGTGPDAFILEIGVVSFSPYASGSDSEYVGQGKNWRIAFDQPNGKIDPGTVAWWMGQENAARNAVFADHDRVPMEHALFQFDQFVEGANDPIIWAKPPSFDCVILEGAYRRHGLKTPWRYNATRDVRTILDLADMTKVDLANPAVKHVAMHDARAQAMDVRNAMRRLKLR